MSEKIRVGLAAANYAAASLNLAFFVWGTHWPWSLVAAGASILCGTYLLRSKP